MVEELSTSLISFCIPAYNSRDTIIRAIKSIQVRYPHEIVIVDNESTDGTYEAIKNLSMDNLKIIVKKSNRGEARNLAAENAISKYIIMLDADVEYVGIEGALNAFWEVKDYEKKLVLINSYDSSSGNTPVIITAKKTFLYLGGFPNLLASEDKYLFRVAEKLGIFQEIKLDLGFKPLKLRGMGSGNERRYSKNKLEAIKRRLEINRDMIFVHNPGYGYFRNNLKLYGISGNIVCILEYILGKIMAFFVSEEKVESRIKRISSRGME